MPALPKPRLREIFRRRLGSRLRAPFPEVAGNSIAPLEHGAHFYERMIAAIDASERTVDVEMYLWNDDKVGRVFVAALARAARRGVRVRVLVDAYGARAVVGLLDEVNAAGGDVRLFNPFRFRLWRRLFQRTHKKLLLLDAAAAYSGGAGFSLDFSGGKDHQHAWHDRMFEFRGPVVTQLEVLFENDFARWRQSASCTSDPARAAPTLAPPPATGPTTMRVLRGWPDARDFPMVSVDAIRSAKERIWIGTPYFVPPHSVRLALYQAAARGVDVRVVHPCLAHSHPLFHYAVRARYGRWMRKKVRIAEFAPSFYHAKLFVVDRTLAIIGSSNFDSWSWVRNSEIDFAVTDTETVDQVAALFTADLARSREITHEDARVRTLLVSVKQSIASWFEEWL